MFLTILGLSVAILTIAILGLGIQTFFSEKKKFPELSIGKNKALRQKDIYCIKTQQKMIDKGIYKNRKDEISCSNC